jgi:hypothetical protein
VALGLTSAGASSPEAVSAVERLEATQAELDALQAQLALAEVELAAAKERAGVGGSAPAGEVTSATVRFNARVLEAEPRGLRVTDRSGATYRLVPGRGLKVMSGGKRVSLEQVPPGAEVRATVDTREPENRLTALEVIPAWQPRSVPVD